MNFEAAIRLISATTPNVPVSDAIALADAIANDITPAAFDSLQTRIVKWVAQNYSMDYLTASSRNKIEAIKGIRMKFGCGLQDAKAAIDWYLDHPDPMFW